MNPFFAMNPNDDDEERQPDSFDVDVESDVYFLQQAYEYQERLVEEENHSRLTPAIRQLAYDNTPDAFVEYLQMSEHTARDCLLHFNKYIIDLYISKYLRKPTLEDVEKIYNQHVTRHGFSGMLGSIDCANNDINVLDNSLLSGDLIDDKAHVAPDEVFLALGWHLEEIHVTWAHLEKKRTRLRTYTKSMKNRLDISLVNIEKRRDTPLLERKDIIDVGKLGSNKDNEGIEWLDVEEPLDLVDTSHKFTANAYIDVDLPMNIMSLAYYNSIRKNGYEYRGRNFVGLGRDMHVFVGDMSYVIVEFYEYLSDPDTKRKARDPMGYQGRSKED
ncbi:hypothetical protein Tco_1016687 [Tanacetum coccineum]|uniref:Uncharacterized protein n=1 Tax=Tanacetum coccineum TaxID=301880 RepID=A0ABQ5FPC8_9ASTR